MIHVCNQQFVIINQDCSISMIKQISIQFAEFYYYFMILIQVASQRRLNIKSEALPNSTTGLTKKELKEQNIQFFQLYRFADKKDKILIFIGIIFSCLTGCGLPFFAFIWGKMIDVFSRQGQQLVDEAAQNRDLFLLIGAATFLAGWVSFGCWILVGERIAIRCRKAYFSSLINQQIGFYDLTNQQALYSHFQSDILVYQRAIGEISGSLIMICSMFICGLAIAFATRWTLTLVVIGSLPFLGITGFLYNYLAQTKKNKFMKFYQPAGSRVEQAISAIRTVKQLNGQQHQYKKYQDFLKLISQKIFQFTIFAGIGSGLFFMAQFFVYAFGFWYGSHCAQGSNVCADSVTGSKYSAGQVVTVFFVILVGSHNFMQLVPSFRILQCAMKSAYRLYGIIDRVPLIKSPQNGKIIQNLKGVIKFQNVTFAYPKNKKAIILKNLNLQLNAYDSFIPQIQGISPQTSPNISFQSQQKNFPVCCSIFQKQKIKNNDQYLKSFLKRPALNVQKSKIIKTNTNSNALVGEPGSGKQTIVQLIMRFYDADEGRITIDGVDIKQLDLKWLRQQIGYVSHQPILFATSIKQNIKYGKPDATDQDLQNALRQAEIYEFVNTLQKKLDTQVGYRGGNLSEEQRQRISIARAIVKNPKILILDEAASKFDRRNQKLIQRTLEAISEGKTSIIVSDRVNRIRNCKNIHVLEKGKLIESGPFHKLQIYKNYQQAKENQNYIKEDGKDDQNNEDKGIQNNIELEDKVELYYNGLSKQQRIQKEEKMLMKKYSKTIFKRLFTYTVPDRQKFVLGVISSMFGGVVYPVFSIFMAKLIVALFSLSSNDHSVVKESRDDANRNCLIITLIGVVAFICHFFQLLLFSEVGENLTQKIRLQAYRKILKMPMTWLDLPKNSASAVARRLSIDFQLVNSLSTISFAILIKNITTIVSSFIIAFIFEWRLALLGLISMPLIIAAGFLSMLFYGGFGDKSDQIYGSSSRLIAQSIINVKTVKQIGYQNVFSERYDKMLEQPLKYAFKRANFVGLLYGISQFFIFLSFAFLFYLGAIIIRDNSSVEVVDVFTAIFTIIWSGWTTGNNFSFMPDIQSGKKLVSHLFYILDHRDQQQLQLIEQSLLLKSGIQNQNSIIFEGVSFKYPHTNDYALKNINLNIKAGEKIGFVGPSGSGKSTTIQLLLRFYRQTKGKILINGRDIKQYDIDYLRSCFGVFGQEALLFNGTFRQNIKYNIQDATDQDIREAAKKANALSFIEGLQNKRVQNPEKNNIQNQNKEKGFSKNVGMSGSYISVGQRQRVAIARTILKTPKIMLLDEPTSALDSSNQKLVQESLNQIIQGKTSISIANRLQDLKNSDKIYVFDKGQLVQEGKYNDLVKKKGNVYSLQRGIGFT